MTTSPLSRQSIRNATPFSPPKPAIGRHSLLAMPAMLVRAGMGEGEAQGERGGRGQWGARPRGRGGWVVGTRLVGTSHAEYAWIRKAQHSTGTAPDHTTHHIATHTVHIHMYTRYTHAPVHRA